MLDTKLKNNKQKVRKGLLSAVLLAMIMSVGFIMLYPQFARSASNNLDMGNPEAEEFFLTDLFKNNYILNKYVKERAMGTKLSYTDLYTEVTRDVFSGTMEEALRNTDNRTDVRIGDNSFEYETMQMWKSNLESTLNYVKESLYDGLNDAVDFCAIDHETGMVYKNTSRSPEQIAYGNEDWENPYVYYVKIEFDKSGNPYFLVYGENADMLLREVQKVSQYVESEMFSGIMDGWEKVIFYNNEGSGNMVLSNAEMLTMELKPISDVTIIYAMTQQQLDDLRDGNIIIDGRNIYPSKWSRQRWSYYSSGAIEVYYLFLAALTVFALIQMRLRGYKIAESKYCKAPIELVLLIALWILSEFANEIIIELLWRTNYNYFYDLVTTYITRNRIGMYIVIYGINFTFLFLSFAVWYWCVACFTDIRTLGLKRFLCERSFILRSLGKAKDWCARKWRAFKENILHVDLNGDIEKTLAKAVAINCIVLSVISCLWFFGIAALLIYSVVLFSLLRKYASRVQEQYQNLLKATASIAEGNLHTSVETDLGVFNSYKDALYEIQEGFRHAVDEEVKSEKLKTELITNVSHDLKTPLTAIITYIDLLKEEGVTEEQRREYISTLENKSLRLKLLIEDLFEVSKAESGNITLHPVEVDLCNLLRQVYMEHNDQIEELGLEFRFDLPEERILLMLDSEKTYRIFENLYVNIIKYAMPHTRVYVNAEETEKQVSITMKNMSAKELNIRPEELTERFVRGDASRNTEGSGLGLAIARSFAELQGGQMKISIDGDLYKVIITFKK